MRPIKPGQRYRHGWILIADHQLPNGDIETRHLGFNTHEEADAHAASLLTESGYPKGDIVPNIGDRVIDRLEQDGLEYSRGHMWAGNRYAAVMHNPNPDRTPGKKYDRAKKGSETGSAKIDKIVDHARSLGLDVEVTKDEKYGARYVDVSIRQHRTEVATALDLVRQSDWISLSFKTGETGSTKPVAPKLVHARKYGYGSGEGRELKASEIAAWVKMMGEDFQRTAELKD